jgi:DNA uptake protein ComE-like DNA-binding protein
MVAGKNPDGPLDLNKATYLELRRIAGLGEVAARSIIGNREFGYVFRDVREIMKCRSVGKGTYEKVAGKLFV